MFQRRGGSREVLEQLQDMSAKRITQGVCACRNSRKNRTEKLCSQYLPFVLFHKLQHFRTAISSMKVDGCILRRPLTWQLCRRTKGGRCVWIPLGLVKFSRNPGSESHPWDRLPSLVRYWSHKGTQVVLFTRALNGRIVWLQFDVSVLFNELLFTLVGLHWVTFCYTLKIEGSSKLLTFFQMVHARCWTELRYSQIKAFLDSIEALPNNAKQD